MSKMSAFRLVKLRQKNKKTAPPRPTTPPVQPAKAPPPKPVASSKNLFDFDFADAGAAKNLKIMKDKGTRLFKGAGQFGSVIKKAEEAQKNFSALQKGDTKVTLAQVTQQLENLKQEASDWLAEDEGRSAGDETRRFKEMVCKDQIKRASTALTQLKNKNKLNDPQVQAKLKELDQKRAKIDAGDDDPKLADECRALDAEILADVCGMETPPGGTSEVYLIKAPDGSVAYAFKTIDGESDQTGMAKGSGAVREVLVSRLCQGLKESGVDFGWPESSMATIKTPDGKSKSGALIQGIPGEEVLDREALIKIQDPAKNAKKKAKSRELLAKIPPKEIQKVALCNLAFSQFDIKWGNAMFETGDGAPKARPLDAGAAMPPDDMLMNFAYVMDRQPGAALLIDDDEQMLPAADAPLDQEVRDMFLKIDVQAMQEAAETEMERLKKENNLDAAQLGAAEGLETAVQSIEGIQEILKANPKMSLNEFLVEYHKVVVGQMVKDRLPAWEKQVLADYGELRKKYPGLLPDPGDRDPKEIYNAFLDKMQQERLDRLQKAGGVALLQQWKVPCPIARTVRVTLDGVNTEISKAIKNIKADPNFSSDAKLQQQAAQLKALSDQLVPKK